MILALGAVRAAVFYVASDAAGEETGDCWADAFSGIQPGIDAAHATGGGEVWVKAGVYSGIASVSATDSYESLDPDSVDIVGEEASLSYTSAGVLRQCHLTICLLKGEVSAYAPAVQFSGTTVDDTLAARLSGLMQARDDYVVVANHPSFTREASDLAISAADLADAANAGYLDAMELNQTEDLAKWDYVLSRLDDQAGDCSKIVWALRSEDQHEILAVGFESNGVMMGCIPTSDQDSVYADRRLAFRDMIRRGSLVSLPANSKCGMPAYSLDSADGTASRMQVSLNVDNIGAASSASIGFYGCDYATGSNPGTLLFSAPLSLNAGNTVSFYLTTNGRADGQPLSVAQKANVKYIRPVITWLGSSSRHGYMMPVRIRSNGNWWNGPAHSLAGSQGLVGPSPYPAGGTDTGETIYFNTHTHTTASDGDASPAEMRARYWENYAGVDPAKPRFAIITDHDRCTPFSISTSSVIELRQGVELYGGFSGSESSRDQRDWSANETVIDALNECRCVLADGSFWSDRSGAALDGFTLRNGKASSAYGGGMLITSCSPTIANCTIRDNAAAYGGGLCVSDGSYPTVRDTVFFGNQANGFYDGGGAVYVTDSMLTVADCAIDGNSATYGGGLSARSSHAYLRSCTLTGNTSQYGGGMHLSSSYVGISLCAFTGNSSCSDGGALRSIGASGVIDHCEFTNNAADAQNGRGGALYHRGDALNVQGCRLTGNTAHHGAGIYLGAAPSTIENCVFADNRTTGDGGCGGAVFSDGQGGLIAHNTIEGNSAVRGGALYIQNSAVHLVNNIVAFNTGGISAAGALPVLLHNNVYANTADYEGLDPGNGDISADPLFADRAAGDYHLVAGSPCVNAGTSEVQATPNRDIDGLYRPSGSAVDIGAYELLILSRCPKAIADDQPVEVESAIVTAASEGFFYVEADGREYGIRVRRDGHGLAAGMRARVVGTMRTNEAGERYIEAGAASEAGTGSVAPVGLMLRDVGGSSWRSAETGLLGQRGVINGRGLANVGLLIRAWGSVTNVGSGYAYVDDGSMLWDGTYTESTPNIGVRVICETAGYSQGDRVQVTGISSCFAPLTGITARCILTRGPEDLRRL